MSITDVAQFMGATDQPSDKDYSAEHLFGAPAGEIPSSMNLNDVPSHDQGKTWHCTAYSLTHCVEIIKTLDFNLQALADPEQQWVDQKVDKGNPAYMETEGDSLQHALAVLQVKGLNNKTPAIPLDIFQIIGYARINKDVDTMRQWIAQKSPLYTGSGNHCYCLVGYSDTDKEFVAKNSYGPTWGPFKDGTFRVGYNEIDKLFTPYIVYDKQQLTMIYKDISSNSPMAKAIQWCLDKGYMTGYGTDPSAANRTFMPDKSLTRSEIAQILFNINNPKL